MADEIENKADAEMKDAEEAPKENGVKAEDENEEEEEKEPEKPAEKEENAAEDSRPKVAASDVNMSPLDCTMNCMQTASGKVLMTLTEGGMQYLLASSRATTGIKAGRYAFEVKIVESLNPSEGSGSGDGQKPVPRNLVRVGLSLEKSSIFLADTSDSICFDSEGYFLHGKKRARTSQKFMRGQTVTLVVNMMEGSPNENTVSLFRNGARLSQPQKIPEALIGKTLFPTVTYRNVTVQVNFGPTLSCALPFTCRTFGDAAKADVEVVAVPSPSQHEILFPVGMPDQGYFDWVDDFVAKNPSFTEISDRKIAEWASKSGMWRSKGNQGPASNDKPDNRFGIPLMDDGSVRKVLQAVAPTQSRNFIIPELRANLVAEERKKLLERYAVSGFKAKATVLMGEPTADYKGKVQELILADKKSKAEAIRRRKAQEEERKRLLEEKRKKAEEAKKAREANMKKKLGKKEEEEPEIKEEDEEEKAEDKTEEKEEPAAAVELTEEEKALWYRKKVTPDLDAKTLSKSYAAFSLPTTEEGFAGVDFVWQPQDVCEKTLREWILSQKMTQRVQDLVPGEWFKTEYAKWQKQVTEWRKKQSEWKDPGKRKAYLAKKAEEAKKKKAEEAKEAGGEEAEEPAEESKPMEINAEDIDVFGVEDVSDLGNGEPLFAHFVYEDWVVLGLHYELHMLLHAFKKDLNDPDRPSFPEEHLAFYYQKYIKKAFKLEMFNLKTMAEFLDMMKESVVLPEGSKFLKPVQEEDTSFDQFMKIAEDHRRDRQRRLDAGDETAKLKFNRPTPPPPKGAQPSGGNARSRYGSSDHQGSRAGGYPRGSAPSYPPAGSRGGSSYGGGGSSGPWKRGPPPTPAHPPSKYQRTSSYGSAPPRGGSGGYYRR